MSAVRDIVVLPGDGIGAVVCEQTVRVLNAAGFQANYHHGDIGWEFWCKEGNALPQRTIELIDKYKVALFGAITSKPKAEAEAELAAELKGKGHVYYSPIVTLRQHYNLDVCVRPCKSIAGNPLNFIRRKTDGSGYEEPKVDAVIFRQNTECMYCGVEWTNPSDKVYEALQTHPKFKPFAAVPRQDLAVSCRIFTRGACRRICEAAFEYAVKHGYKNVTVCEKPNVVRETSGMMESMAREIGKKYKLPVYSTNIDAQMMWMTKSPEDYGIIIASNMFGDIASDGFAGLIGGLGFASSANLGSGGVAVFEPTHGSAPKYQSLKPSIVNPIACILSACQMLDYLGEDAMSKKIHEAIEKVVREGKVRTYDMMRLRGGPQVISQGAASTEQITDAIIAAL